MKHSILMLAVIGMMHYSAMAQNGEDKKSEFDINYKVCRVDDKYRVCNGNTPNIVYTKPYIKKKQAEYAKTIDGLRKYDQYVHVHPLPAVVVKAEKKRVQFNPEFDGSSAVYHGNPSPENDGLAKSIERNKNHFTESVELPANDGSIARK